MRTTNDAVPPSKPGCLSVSAGWSIAGIIIVCTSILLAIHATSEQPTPSTERSLSNPIPPEKPCLELVKHRGILDSDHTGKIVGTVRNNCDRSYRYVEVEFKLTDSEGAVTGTAMTNVTALGPREDWKFEAIALNAYARYQLVHVKGD